MKITKIYEDEKEIYSGNCFVNTVIFTGRLKDNPAKIGTSGVKFLLQISNGKDEKTGEWHKPTFADCTAFGEVGQKILDNYKAKDELWLTAKYYCKQHEGKYYKGFTVREIITEKEIEQAGQDLFSDEDIPF